VAVRDPKDLQTEKTYTVAMAKGSAQLTLKSIQPSTDE
jgi:hypothetical protein